MTVLDYMIWFLATAVMIITVLTIGTLAAADLLPHRRHPHDQSTSPRLDPAQPDDAEQADAPGTRRRHERTDAA